MEESAWPVYITLLRSLIQRREKKNGARAPRESRIIRMFVVWKGRETIAWLCAHGNDSVGEIKKTDDAREGRVFGAKSVGKWKVWGPITSSYVHRNWLQIGKRDQQRHEKSMPYRQKIFMVGEIGKHVYSRYLWLCHLENTDVVSIRSKSPWLWVPLFAAGISVFSRFIFSK